MLHKFYNTNTTHHVFTFAIVIIKYSQLDIGVLLNLEGEPLADIYVSLALSYSDAKRYEEAIEFYEHELKTGCRKPQEVWLSSKIKS